MKSREKLLAERTLEAMEKQRTRMLAEAKQAEAAFERITNEVRGSRALLAKSSGKKTHARVLTRPNGGIQ
jgi:hypothetical protein